MSKVSQVSQTTANAMRDKSGGRVLLSQYGGSPGAESNQSAFALALAAAGDGGTVYVDALYPITAGLIVNRPCRIVGAGPATGFIASATASRQYHIMTVASSNVCISDIRVSGATGDLTLGEPAGIHIHDPTNPAAGGISGYSNIRVSGVTVDDCETGVRVGYQADNTINQIRSASGVVVEGCTISARQYGVELFYSSKCVAANNFIHLLASGSPGSRMAVRFSGASDCIASGNIVYGLRDSGSIAFHVGSAVAYGLPVYFRDSSDCIVSGNSVDGFIDGVYFAGNAGSVAVLGNKFRNVTNCLQMESTVSPYGIDLFVNRAIASGNEARNVSNFAVLRGRIRSFIVSNNHVVCDGGNDGRFLFLNQPATARCEYMQITGNTCALNSAALGGTIRIIGTKTGETYLLSGNAISPDGGGGVLANSGDAVIAPYDSSNTKLPTGLWASVSPAI